MLDIWNSDGAFVMNEQRLADQARAIKTNGWLSEIEIEEIKMNIAANGDHQERQSDPLTMGEYRKTNKRGLLVMRTYLKKVRATSLVELLKTCNMYAVMKKRLTFYEWSRMRWQRIKQRNRPICGK